MCQGRMRCPERGHPARGSILELEGHTRSSWWPILAKGRQKAQSMGQTGAQKEVPGRQQKVDSHGKDTAARQGTGLGR